MTTDSQPGDADGIEKRIRDYVTQNFLLGENLAIDSTASLLSNGVLDSTGVLELVTFLESEFGVQVGDAEMVPQNLDSLSNLADFVRRKLSASPAVASCAQTAKPS